MANSAASASHSLKYLISGAARGLGRGLARSLLIKGHSVFLLDSNESELNHTLTVHLPKTRESHPDIKFGSFSGSIADISSIQSIQSAMKKVSEFYKDEEDDESSIDVLVNNASRTSPYWESGNGKIENVDPLEWKNFVDVNLNGTFFLTQAALPLLRKSKVGPSIINISSTRSKMSEPLQEGYASTKAALLGLTHSLASSLAPQIRVNAILPGWIPSGHESKEGDEKDLKWDHELTEADQNQHWTGRVGQIEDFYKTVLYLSECGFVTGQEIVIDGGMTKKMIYEE